MAHSRDGDFFPTSQPATSQSRPLKLEPPPRNTSDTLIWNGPPSLLPTPTSTSANHPHLRTPSPFHIIIILIGPVTGISYFAYTNREVLQLISIERLVLLVSAVFILTLAYAIWLQFRIGNVERENEKLQTSHNVAMMYNSLFENAPIWLAVVEVASVKNKKAFGDEAEPSERGDMVGGDEAPEGNGEADVDGSSDRRGSSNSTVVGPESTETLPLAATSVHASRSHLSAPASEELHGFSNAVGHSHGVSMLSPRRLSAESVVAMDTGGATIHPRDPRADRNRYSTTSLLTARTSMGDLEGGASIGLIRAAGSVVVSPTNGQIGNGTSNVSASHSDSGIADPESANRPAYGAHSLNDCSEALKVARECEDGKTYDFRILRVNRPVHDKFGLEREEEILEKWIHGELRRPQGRVDMFCRGLMESRQKGVVEFAVNLPVCASTCDQSRI